MGDESLHLPDDNLEYCIVTLFEKIDALRNETVYMSPKFWKVSFRHELRSLEFWRSVIFECIASFCYVFIVCGATASAGAGASKANVLFATAFAAGLSVTTLTQCFAHTSGAHINPAVTIAMSITNNITCIRAIMFVIAQCGGGIAGAAFLYGMTMSGYQYNLSVALVHTIDIVPSERLGIESILTFIIALTYLMSMDTYTKWLGSSSITIGASYAACTFVSMPCLNPARSLGPSFVLNKWENHWVDWIGPLAGAAVSGVIYRFVLNPRRCRRSKNADDGDSSSIHSDEDPYDDLEKPNGNKYNTYRQTGNTVVTSGSGYCPSLMSASLYSAPLCKLERVESLYGGTKSLYCKSPPLTRANLNRSQSVYTKTNTTVNRDISPRPGPLVPAQSLYPMRLNQQQNYVQNQNVQNQIQQRTETTFTGRTMQPLGTASRSDVYVTVNNGAPRSNASDAETTKYEDNPEGTRNRPKSMYGVSPNHTARHGPGEESNYTNYYGSTKRSNTSSTVAYHNTASSMNSKTTTVNNGYGARVSEVKQIPSTSSSFHHTISQHSPSQY